jgi:OmpA-OmpF porin, OOP family
MNRRILSIAVAAALVAGSTAALAQQTNKPWYGGVSIGQSKVKIEDNAFGTPAGFTTAGTSKDETDTGYKIFVGYRFNQNFAVEGGWTDFGKFNVSQRFTVPAGSSVNASFKASGVHVDAVGIWPLQNNFSLFGKVGGIYTEMKTSLSTSGGIAFVPGVNTSPKKSELNLKLGLGAQYDINQSIGVRAEWERASKVGDSSTGEADIDLLSVGLVYRF